MTPTNKRTSTKMKKVIKRTNIVNLQMLGSVAFIIYDRIFYAELQYDIPCHVKP